MIAQIYKIAKIKVIFERFNLELYLADFNKLKSSLHSFFVPQELLLGNIYGLLAQFHVK
jgi:hypothetical protein